MSIIEELDREQISELNKTMIELYSYDIDYATITGRYLDSNQTVLGAAVSGVVLPSTSVLINGFRNKNEPIDNKDLNNYIEMRNSQLVYNQIDKFIEHSVSTIQKTDAYQILSDTITSSIEKKVGESNWVCLEENSKVFLKTAELLREFLQFIVLDMEVDFSAPTLSYCKSVENELNNKLLIPFIKKCKIKKYRLTKSDFDSKLSIVIRHNNLKLTLGEHAYILKRIVTSKNLTKIEEKYKDFLCISEITSISELNQMLNKVTKYYRNPSSHTSVVSNSECNECREDILSEKGLLPRIFLTFQGVK